MEELLADASQFELFQILRLVEAQWSGRGTLGAGLDRWLRVLPSAELGFPGADVRECTIDTDGRLELRVTALGLYGVDAPVPHYLLDRAVLDDEGAQALREFLDIFNHRLYVLLYHAWQLESALADRPDSPYSAAVAALSAVSHPSQRRFTGAFSQRVHTAQGLEDAIADLLEGVEVEVRDRIPQAVDIEPQAIGGAGLCLGGETLLGERMWVAGGRIQVNIGPLDAAQAESLLPGRPEGDELIALIRRYLEGRATFDLLLRVRPAATAGCRLGDDSVRLGWSTWTGERLAREYQIRINGDQLTLDRREPVPAAVAAAA